MIVTSYAPGVSHTNVPSSDTSISAPSETRTARIAISAESSEHTGFTVCVPTSTSGSYSAETVSDEAPVTVTAVVFVCAVPSMPRTLYRMVYPSGSSARKVPPLTAT